MSDSSDLEMLARISTRFGNDPLLVQGAGGNNSVKSEDGTMKVKASGLALKNLTKESGWVSLPVQNVRLLVEKGPDCSFLNPATDEWLASEIDKITSSPSLGYKASIEAAMHAVLGKIVVHVHPVEINVLLCAEGGRNICDRIFSGIKFLWIDPLPPGYYLARAIHESMMACNEEKPSVILMANHGVIVHAESELEINRLYASILHLAREWLGTHGYALSDLPLEGWESEFSSKDVFPDTVVFQKLAQNLHQAAPEKRQGIIETFAASKAIRDGQAKTGLKSAFLPQRICNYILNMSREKHRQATATKI